MEFVSQDIILLRRVPIVAQMTLNVLHPQHAHAVYVILIHTSVKLETTGLVHVLQLAQVLIVLYPQFIAETEFVMQARVILLVQQIVEVLVHAQPVVSVM